MDNAVQDIEILIMGNGVAKYVWEEGVYRNLYSTLTFAVNFKLLR